MSWKDKIPGCFGDRDKKFARHPSDLGRAREMIKQARSEEATDEEIKEECANYMKSQGCSQDHIDEELDHLDDGLYWL